MQIRWLKGFLGFGLPQLILCFRGNNLTGHRKFPYMCLMTFMYEDLWEYKSCSMPKRNFCRGRRPLLP